MTTPNPGTSEDNSRKLDRILALIEGETNAPGILSKLADHGETLYGKNGSSGIVQKVNIMWRAHVWLLCSISAASGYLLKQFVK